MVDYSKSLNYSFRISNINNLSTRFRLEQKVTKRIQSILYLQEPPTDAIDIEYIGSKELLPLTNLSIFDRSDEVYQNSKNNTTQEIIGEKNSSSVVVANKNFLATQEFIEDTQNHLPLYFKHELSSFTNIGSVKILDKESKEIDPVNYKIVSEYLFNEETGIKTSTIDKYYIFNSLESWFKEDTGEYEVFFLEYEEIINDVSIVHTSLLNNEPAYIEATWEDIWLSAVGKLKPWARAYTLDTTSSLSNYIVGFPASKKYAIKYLEKNRVGIKYPTDFSKEGPWFPRIIDGGFVSSSHGHLSKFDIPEFENQSFNPIEPYKLAVYSKSKKVSDHILKLPNEDLVFGNLFSSLDIYLKEDDQIVYALTTDSSKSSELVYDESGAVVYDESGDTLLWNTTSILGTDRQSGLVFISLNLFDKYTFFSTYSYKEKYYTFTSLLMNPLFDSSIVDELRILYLVPRNNKNNNSSTQTASIKYLKVSTSGRILETNQNGDDYNPSNNFDTKLLNTNGYSIHGFLGLHYSNYTTTLLSSDFTISVGSSLSVSSTSSFPKTGWIRILDSSSLYRYLKYTSKTDTSFTLSSEASDVPTTNLNLIPSGNTIELVNFVDELSIQSRYDLDNEVLYGGESSLPSVFSQYFILGEMSINPPHGIQELTRIDVREDGGGIIEEKYEEAKKLNPEVQWYNDYNTFDGQVYPGSSVATVKLPVSLKKQFSLSQIKSIVSENLVLGVYPLIRFYGYQPRIISITSGNRELEIRWEKEGDEFVYNIWYSKQRNGIFTKANGTRIVDDSGSYNAFTITNLEDDEIYYVKIIMEDKYYSWWYSYSSYSSVEGGLGLTESTPSSPGGNYLNFEFEII